jgi:hypothetical protein
LQFARAAADPTLFTPEARAKVFADRGTGIVESLNSLSMPVAVIHMSELIARREENGLRVYRYVLNDLGKSLFCTVKLTTDGKIASLQVSSE